MALILRNGGSQNPDRWLKEPRNNQYEPFTAQPVRIGEFCDKNPTLPAAMQEQTPTTSRFLDALEKKHSESTRQMADAISFASYRKEVDDHV